MMCSAAIIHHCYANERKAQGTRKTNEETGTC
jgi:hypothetical protein